MQEIIKAQPLDFIKAADELMLLLKSIPKSAIQRHNLLFADIINETMNIQKDNPEVSLTYILAANIPYYMQTGKANPNGFNKGE